MKNEIIFTKMWNDDEINGRIHLQLLNLFANELLSGNKELFLKYASSCMHKLTATKYHLENYRNIEEKQFVEASELFKNDPSITREAFELIFELEAFLFQIKSSLDILVKLLGPIIGNHRVQTKTFGDKGNNLIKGLRKYREQNGTNEVAVDNLINVIKCHQDNWLVKAIEFRDELNHYEALNNFKFIPEKLDSGEIIATKPKFKNNNTLNYMDTIYSNNLILHQDFMAYSLWLRAPQSLVLMKQDPQKAKETFNHKSSKYIKFCWGMNIKK